MVAYASAVAPSGPAAEEAPQASHCHRQASDAYTVQGQRALGLRLRLRYDGRRSRYQIPDRHGGCTRECLAIDVAGSVRSKRVIEVLSKLVNVHACLTTSRASRGNVWTAPEGGSSAGRPVAERLGVLAGIEAGSASPRMNQYERDRRQPTHAMARQLAHALGVPVPYLYADDDVYAQALLMIHALPTSDRPNALDALRAVVSVR